MTFDHFDIPLNSVSLGQVSYNILREEFRAGGNPAVFPVQDKADLQAYLPDEKLVEWINECATKRVDRLKKDSSTLKIWHLHGSERKLGRQTLYSFHETDRLTDVEKKIGEMQDVLAVSSEHTCDLFLNAGINCHYVPLGFDSDWKIEDTPRIPQTHWSLIGKWEKRKNTDRIIKVWAEKFGNSNEHQLTCLVNNPFLDVNPLIARVFGGKHYNNINFLPFQRFNKDVAALQNAADIDLSGLSGAEGWNLPAFNATCLGKWSVVGNHSAHKSWADSDNSILVEPDGIEPIYDGVFFQEGLPFNQGAMSYISDKTMSEGMDRALEKLGTVNSGGISLGERMTYDMTLEALKKASEQ